MVKIASLNLRNHPVLGDLSLDFCNRMGKPVGTVIIAGENGSGKSTVLNCLYDIVSKRNEIECDLTLEIDDELERWTYRYKEDGNIWVSNHLSFTTLQGAGVIEQNYNLNGIYSDVDIIFNSKPISNVTSMTLDSTGESRRSGMNLASQVKQLIIDIQAMDDSAISSAVRSNPNMLCADICAEQRMKRFTDAFNFMFEDLKYDRVENIDDAKAVIFKKNGQDIQIDELSSGEKQIVFRGCFLLKDSNALNGAMVFIDEPETSLHPVWQKKILDYYKRMFTDENGIQTSQIFVATHSPFVINNENRRDDKVIILKRNDRGKVIVEDRKEYYSCDTIKTIEEAFFIHDFSANIPTVYLEGRTDERYFNKTAEVFNLTLPFRFKWIGYIDEKGQESFTGKDSINKAFQFLIAQNTPVKNICLKDVDTNSEEKQVNNTYLKIIPYYDNARDIKCGIENALVLNDVDTSSFYSEKEKVGAMGEKNSIQEFKKMDFCDYICSLDDDSLRKILGNLLEQIEGIIRIFA